MRRILRSTLSIVALAGLGIPSSCSDSTGPLLGQVSVSVTSIGGPTLEDQGNGLQLSCDVNLAASAKSGQAITWLDATFRIYAGRDTSIALDTAIVPDSIIRDSWASDSSGVNHFVSEWIFSAPTPFVLSLSYRYLLGGRQGSTTVFIPCGPTLAPHTIAPTITVFQEHGTGPFEPGGLLMLDYAANSALALWETSVHVSGPCDTTVTSIDSLRVSVQRTLVMTLPRSCPVGGPINVSVTATDASLQTSTRSLNPALVLADTTPPAVGVLEFPPEGGPSSAPGGDYFAGDLITLNVFAGDNHALSSVGWVSLPTGTRDSLLLTAADYTWNLNLRVHPEWVGAMELQFFARDASGNIHYISSGPAAYHIYPQAAIVSQVGVTVDASITDFIIDGHRGVIDLLQGSRISELDPVTRSYVRTLDLVEPGLGFDVTAGGDSLVVALPFSLGIVDLRQTPLMMTTIPLVLDSTVSQAAVAVRVASNGKAFVATQGRTGAAARLIEVDLGTLTQKVRMDAGSSGLFAGGVGRSYDHSVLYINSSFGVQRYDVMGDSFGPLLGPGGDLTPQVDADGGILAIADDLYDGGMHFLRKVQGGCGCGSITAISPDGSLHYRIRWPQGTIRSRVSDGSTFDVVRDAILAGAVRVSDDGHTVVTTAGPNIYVIKLP